ncbi:MAG: LuxR C-terminal-related transcriptional regulator [Muribaculaceae bacterium]|nr:LuxR C-terminal-related transcriptional regulator [Muribaculaceae bacterium]
MRYILSTLLLICFVLSAFCQIPAIRNFGPRDYNGGTQNWNVAESDGKTVFVGNTIGLIRYDGNSWTTGWTPNHTTVHGVIFREKSNRIYVGAFEEFGFFRNLPPLHKAPYVSLSAKIPDKYKVGQDIWQLVEMSDGRIIFSSKSILYTYTEYSNYLHITPSPENIENVSSVAGNIYVATENSLYSFNGRRFKLIDKGLTKKYGLICGAVRNPFGKGVMFITRSGNLLFYDGKGITSSFPSGKGTSLLSAIRGCNLFCIAESEHLIVIGTVGHGLFLYDKTGDTLQTIERSNGLRNNTVLSLHIDNDENVWAGLDNGLSFVMLDSPFRSILGELQSVGTGYASASLGQRLYLGTNQGVYHVELPGNTPLSSFTPIQVNGVNGQIWSLVNIGDRLLCGADNGAYEVIGNNAIPIDGLKGTWGFRKMPGEENTWIVSHYNGLSLLRRENGKLRVISNLKGVDECSVNFEVGADGTIWYSHWLQGIYCVQTDPTFSRVIKKTVYNAGNQLDRDDNNLVTKIRGKVYVCASDGYYERNPKDGKLKKVEWLTRLFPTDGITTRLIETPKGDIWSYRPGHLLFARRDGNNYVTRKINNTELVNRLQLNLGNLSYLSGGRTIMNQDDGFFVVNPNYKHQELRHVLVNYVSSLVNSSDGGENFVYRAGEMQSSDQHFVVEPGNSSLYFDFTLPQYHDEKAVKYSTFVEGFDHDWTPYHLSGSRRLDNLKPGKYVMYIRAYDTVTGFIDNTRITFEIKPVWYRTWWALTLEIIIGCVLMYLGVDWVKRRIESSIERRRLAEERRRIEQEEKDSLLKEHDYLKEKNLRLNEEIKRKSGELAGSDINLKRKADILKDIRENLDVILSIPPYKTEDIRRGVSSLRGSLNFHSSEDSNWENIHENFNIVFDDLLKKLVNRYPNLTRNDLRICSYLRMNMSTKEIASLMNISERSVESHRYRLRKRLGMISGQSFTDFFNSIDK